jgi:hypothetical protein
MSQQFLTTVDRLQEEKSPEYALGYVKGCIEKAVEIEALKKEITDLKIQIDLLKPIKTIPGQYAEHKLKQQQTLPKQSPTRTKLSKAEVEHKILNQLKLYDHLDSKDLGNLIPDLAYPTLMAHLGRLRKEGKIRSWMKGKSKQRGLNWALPEAQKLQYKTVKGTTH